MHLYQFLRYCSVNNNKYEYSKLQWMVYNNLNKKGKIRTDRFNNIINENRNILNEKNLKNFGYLFKLNLIDLIGNEDLITMNIEYNLIFIFNNIAWSNIVYLFKIYGINLYGGSNSRRHLLSTVQTKLVSFLMLLNDLAIDYNSIYKSFNEINSSTARIEYEFLNMIRSRKPLTLDILRELSKREDFSSNEHYYIHSNLMVTMYLNIRDIIFKCNDIINEINIINSEIKNDKDRVNSKSKSESAWELKKVRNAENWINNNLLLIKDLENKKDNLIIEYSNHCLDFINKFPQLFNDDGSCKLDNQINKDLSFDRLNINNINEK